jgi:multisubunit Na+/H+ antiporter MnhE subunit
VIAVDIIILVLVGALLVMVWVFGNELPNWARVLLSILVGASLTAVVRHYML